MSEFNLTWNNDTEEFESNCELSEERQAHMQSIIDCVSGEDRQFNDDGEEVLVFTVTSGNEDFAKAKSESWFDQAIADLNGVGIEVEWYGEY